MKNFSVGKKIELLQNTDLFSNLKPIELSIIADYSEIYNHKRGDILFVEGSLSSRFYVIVEGEVSILRDREGDNQLDVARFVSGDSFGELDLLGNTARSATAICIKDSVLLVFPAGETTLESIFEKHPFIASQILNKLMAIIANRIRETNILISEKTPWTQQLRRQLHTDKLTGLYNKMFLDDEIENLLHACNYNAAILLFKPDNFKEVNDHYGHEAGDRTLRLLAILLYSVLREQDFGIRYRGDEFAAFLPGADYEIANKIYNDINMVINGMDLSNITGTNNIKLTISVGLAFFEHETYQNNIIQKAYDNMLTARKEGGDKILYEG